MSLKDIAPIFRVPYDPSQMEDYDETDELRHKQLRPLSERLRDGTTVILDYDPGEYGLPFDEYMKRALRGDFDDE